MPHIEISHYPRELNEEEKQAFSTALTQVICEHLQTPESAVSIVLTEVLPEHWKTQIVQTKLLPVWSELLKQPGYDV